MHLHVSRRFGERFRQPNDLWIDDVVLLNPTLVLTVGETVHICCEMSDVFWEVLLEASRADFKRFLSFPYGDRCLRAIDF